MSDAFLGPNEVAWEAGTRRSRPRSEDLMARLPTLPLTSRPFSRAREDLTARRAALAGLIAAIGVGLGTAGCTIDSVVAAVGLPGTTQRATISNVSVRFEYIDAFVEAGAFRYRFFFPDREPCRSILNAPENLSFVWLGPLGRITKGEERCSPVGVLSLREWRNRGPRRSREPLPRGQAVFKEIWRDGELVLIRGRFPLAGLANWKGGHDTIGILPNSETCIGFLERGVASIEFRASGNNPLVLIDRRNLCPIQGFAQPLPAPGESDAPSESGPLE